jgi:MSHA biogenesis protein MshO
MRNRNSCSEQHQRGFTLVELIMVIVIMGVIGGMVSVFMKSPIDAYFASARRAALTDVADTVVRRMARDIRKALPNSIATTTNGPCVEFIPTKTGGRYRSTDGSGSLTTGTTSFTMLGSNATFAGPLNLLPPDQQIEKDDVIVVGNTGQPGADAYNNDNTMIVGAPPFTPSGAPNVETSFPLTGTGIPALTVYNSSRFQVVPATERVVSYVCDPVSQELRRGVDATNFTHDCPRPGALLARGATCTFKFDQQSATDALIRINLQLTESGETVSLYHEVHIGTSP